MPNMIISTMKIRLSCKLWVQYLQNQAIYVNLLFVKVMRNLNFTKFWNPEILPKCWDFWLIFCFCPLNIPSNKCYITTWSQKWLLPWFLRGRASEAPAHGSHRIWYPMGGMVNPFHFGAGCGWGLGGHHPLLESAIFLEPNIVLTLDKSVHSIVIIVQ